MGVGQAVSKPCLFWEPGPGQARPNHDLAVKYSEDFKIFTDY